MGKPTELLEKTPNGISIHYSGPINPLISYSAVVFFAILPAVMWPRNNHGDWTYFFALIFLSWGSVIFYFLSRKWESSYFDLKARTVTGRGQTHAFADFSELIVAMHITRGRAYNKVAALVIVLKSSDIRSNDLQSLMKLSSALRAPGKYKDVLVLADEWADAGIDSSAKRLSESMDVPMTKVDVP